MYGNIVPEIRDESAKKNKKHTTCLHISIKIPNQQEVVGNRTVLNYRCDRCTRSTLQTGLRQRGVRGKEIEMWKDRTAGLTGAKRPGLALTMGLFASGTVRENSSTVSAVSVGVSLRPTAMARGCSYRVSARCSLLLEHYTRSGSYC